MSKAEEIKIYGAKEHNLKNIDLVIPRNKLVVFTGLSGSGKSSLAFDTLFAEGQRRYIETFSAYARQFIGGMERPDVDKIEGLSPVISIEQKTVSKSPRSTVGTITELYDFLRLLFSRVASAYSSETGELMVKYTDDQLANLLSTTYKSKKVAILASKVRARKGHYRELFEQIVKTGYTKVALLNQASSDARNGLNIESLNKFFMLIEITDGFGGNELFNKIARVNAARLLYADKKYDEALNLLEKYSSSSSAMIHELLGDILAKQEKIDLAVNQYLLSKDKYTDETSTLIVSMKISNLSK